METRQALRTLGVKGGASQEEIKTAYRRLALKLHPDRTGGREGAEFRRVTDAYNHLKEAGSGMATGPESKGRGGAGRQGAKKSPWGGPGTPEEDWSRYTRHIEEGDPGFWKEYERRFWEEYEARTRDGGRDGGRREKKGRQDPDLAVHVDESLCIGCCSCEIIAPDVFRINKETKSNPKSSVINRMGAGADKIMNAARTCPTKAISVDDLSSRERLFPY